jgi:hypothetical protein
VPLTLSRSRLAAVLAAFVLAACTGGSDGGDDAAPSRPSEADIVAQVASFDLAVGPPRRLIVGVQTGDRRFIAYGTVAFRFAYLGTRQSAQPGAFGPPVTATFLPIPGTQLPSPVPSEPRAVNPSEARGVYAAEAGFERAGFWQVEVTARVGGEERKAVAAFAVNEKHAVPAPGEPALPTENHLLGSTDAAPAAIDSRAATGEVPDPALHRSTIAAALAAKRPAVVVFATPVYCQSQFCGPVTDMVDELAGRYGDRASFIHVEIWRDFQSQTINKAAADWLFRDNNLNEPWVFFIDAAGRIGARFDNVATAGELEPLLQSLPVIGPAT